MIPSILSGGRRLAVVSLVLLTSCEAAGTLAGGGAQSDYLVARQALETGNYDLAVQRYGRLMGSLDSGSASRVQLEYAHALLRANRYDDAIAAADPLIAGRDGSIQASALAVRGTARHEAARARLTQGQADAATRALLEGAREDLTRFTRENGPLDTAGSMRARLQLIAADLETLGRG